MHIVVIHYPYETIPYGRFLEGLVSHFPSCIQKNHNMLKKLLIKHMVLLSSNFPTTETPKQELGNNH